MPRILPPKIRSWKVVMKAQKQRPLRRMQWRLTFSYTLITVMALLVEYVLISVAGILVFSLVVNRYQTYSSFTIENNTEEAAQFFHQGVPDRKALTAWMQGLNPTPGFSYQGFVAVTDSQGRVIASKGSEHVVNGTTLATHLPVVAQTRLNLLLSGRQTPLDTFTIPDGILDMRPIVDRDNHVDGVLLLKTQHVQSQVLETELPGILVTSPIILAVLALVAGFFGSLFGYFTARNFTRRFSRLSYSVDRWSHGDFDSFIQDASHDEIGQVARRLNRLAEQLQDQLRTRQELATLEERNRLARELHDSVKQQIFALSMRISTARELLDSDLAAARLQLDNIEEQIAVTQQELGDVIRELRPVALESKGLAQALRDSIEVWEGQTGIIVTRHIDNQPSLAAPIEEALYRITQEALSNIARHSKATEVRVLLQQTPGQVNLIISDNGRGFDVKSRRGQGIGLLSMQERLALLNGKIEIESTRGKGTILTIYCPTGTTSNNSEQASSDTVISKHEQRKAGTI